MLYNVARQSNKYQFTQAITSTNPQCVQVQPKSTLLPRLHEIIFAFGISANNVIPKVRVCIVKFCAVVAAAVLISFKTFSHHLCFSYFTPERAVRTCVMESESPRSRAQGERDDIFTGPSAAACVPSHVRSGYK